MANEVLVKIGALEVFQAYFVGTIAVMAIGALALITIGFIHR